MQLPVNAATVVERQHSPAEQGEEVARVGTSLPAHRTKVCNGHNENKSEMEGTLVAVYCGGYGAAAPAYKETSCSN